MVVEAVEESGRREAVLCSYRFYVRPGASSAAAVTTDRKPLAVRRDEASASSSMPQPNAATLAEAAPHAAIVQQYAW